jgi:predicted esterase
MKYPVFSVLPLCAALFSLPGAVAAAESDTVPPQRAEAIEAAPQEPNGEATKAEPKGDAAKAEPKKPETKAEPSKSGAGKADSKSDASKARSSRPDSGKADPKAESSKSASKPEPRDPNRPERLDLPRGPAFYVRPAGGHGLKPVLVYLHGRGGNPEADCAKWAPVARDFGWILCPSGPEDRGGGSRAWANNWIAAKNVVDGALAALREKFGRRVQLRGNTLIGFSEGAYVAMNIGVREPEVYNRWLILAANDGYWGGEGQDELVKQNARIKRVYLLTGEQDGVVDNTRRVFDILDQAGVHVIMRTPEWLAHETPVDRMRRLYIRPLRWLNDIP